MIAKQKLAKLAINGLTLAIASLPTLALAQDLSLGLEYGSATGLGSGDLRAIITSFIQVLLGFLGLIAVIIILVGGFKWMTAMGNEDTVDKAKDLIKAGVIGLVIVLAAYAIATFVINTIVTATTVTTQ
jgi:amino acid transporter